MTARLHGAGSNPLGLCCCGCGEITPIAKQSNSATGDIKGRHVRYVRFHRGNGNAGRFWAKVNKNGPIPTHRPELGRCWIWTAAHSKDGYGKFWVNGRDIRAHRFSYKLEHKTLDPTLQVLHACDNPPCVRPSHLFQGTTQDNTADAMAKGRLRGPRGEAQGHSKLTSRQVQLIRRLAAKKILPTRLIGARFGVSRATINRIVSGRVWAWLPRQTRGKTAT